MTLRAQAAFFQLSETAIGIYADLYARLNPAETLVGETVAVQYTRISTPARRINRGDHHHSCL